MTHALRPAAALLLIAVALLSGCGGGVGMGGGNGGGEGPPTDSTPSTSNGSPVVALSLNVTTVQLGGSATLSWASADASRCTASGDWQGTQATLGSVVVQPTSTGHANFALTCTNAAGVTETRTVTLVVTGP